MPRYNSGRYSAGRSSRANRASLTRRGLLGAAAILTGAGIADLMHKSGSASARAIVDGGSTPRIPTTSSARPPAGTAATSPGQPTSTSSVPPATPTHVPESVPPVHHPAEGHAGAHGRSHSGAHFRRVDNVTLPPPKLPIRTRPIYYVDDLIHDAPKHAIALTVDDGPDPDYTPKVLRLLDKYRMQASFCIVGVHAVAYPKLIRDIHRAGHVIVNHTYTHVQPFNHQTEKRIVGEITRTQRAIEKAAKVTPQLFRAPGGAWSPFIFRAVAAYDLIPLDWDVDPMDWAMPGTRRIERAMLRGRPNDIVLCHDGGGNRTETVRALRKVLPEWKHRGYVTVPLIPPKDQRKPPPPPATHSTPSNSPSTSIEATTSTSPTATP